MSDARSDTLRGREYQHRVVASPSPVSVLTRACWTPKETKGGCELNCKVETDQPIHVVTRTLLGTSASLLVTSALLVVTRTLLGLSLFDLSALWAARSHGQNSSQRIQATDGEVCLTESNGFAGNGKDQATFSLENKQRQKFGCQVAIVFLSHYIN